MSAPLTKEEAFARLDEHFVPTFKRILTTEIRGDLSWDKKSWDWFIDYITGPLMKRILFDEAKGPYCLSCEAEDSEWDSNHDFSPRDRTGMPPCLCGHILQAHSKGERGEANPFYRYFEILSRGKKPVPGMGPNPPLYDTTMIAMMFQLASEFEKFRRDAYNYFGVVNPEPVKDGATG